MNILVNAYNLASGGGYTIGYGFVIELMELSETEFEDAVFYVIVPNSEKYPFKSSERVKILNLPDFYTSFPGKLWAEKVIAKLCERYHIDKIISLTNYAIPIKNEVPQVLLIQWPYLFNNDPRLWNQMHWISRLRRIMSRRKILRLVKYVQKIVVQTPLMREKVLNVIQGKEVKVLPGFHNFGALLVSTDRRKINEKTDLVKLFFPSIWYEHKNHDILLELGEICKQEHSVFRFYVTIRGSKAERFMNKVRKRGLEQYIVNLGELDRDKIANLYPTFQGLFFPTLLETYGIPYIEAMHFGLPVFTSDREFAHEVCGEWAVYFDPLNASDIYQKLIGFDFNKPRDTSLINIPNRKKVVKTFLIF